MKKVPSLTKMCYLKLNKLSTNYIFNMSFLLLVQDFKTFDWDDVSEDYSGACIFKYKFSFHLALVLPMLMIFNMKLPARKFHIIQVILLFIYPLKFVILGIKIMWQIFVEVYFKYSKMQRERSWTLLRDCCQIMLRMLSDFEKFK